MLIVVLALQLIEHYFFLGVAFDFTGSCEIRVCSGSKVSKVTLFRVGGSFS